MTRTGKIARLPKAVRDQLNKNLADGVPGVRLVDWLNGLPEVQAVLTSQFDGRDINEVNVSEWKAGGYVDWQARQDMLVEARELAEEAQDLKKGLAGSLTEHLSVVVAGRYAQLLNSWNGEVDEAFLKKLKGLRLLCQDVAVLRNADLRAERLASDQKQFDNSMRCHEVKGLVRCLDESKEYPEVAAAFRTAFALLTEYKEGKKENEAYLEQERKRREEEEERDRLEWIEKQRLEDEAKERKRQKEDAEVAARKARWQEAHPGQDLETARWWDWKPEAVVEERAG